MQHEMHDEISLEMGRRVVARWLRQNADAPGLVRCYREWQAILERSLDEICETLCADTDEGRRLRQNSPFAGDLPPAEVWFIKSALRQCQALTAA